MRPAFRAIIAFGAVLTLTWFVYGRALEILPFSGDNLYVLSLVDHAAPSALVRGDPSFYPEWRPLPIETIWLQYRRSNIDGARDYFLVNLLLWATSAWLVYHIVQLLANSTPAALVAAAFVATDPRPVFGLAWIIERQSSMACLFGLLAVIIVINGRRQPLTRLQWVGVFVLLLASGLSKEYGLAFAGALAVYSLRERQYDITVAAITAAVTYATLRLALAGGAAAGTSQTSGFFLNLRTVHYDGLHRAVFTQSIYNIGATAINSLLPGFFTSDGRVGVAPQSLLRAAAWMIPAGIGWWKGPRVMQMLAFLIAFNALLNFMVYLERNQLVALCAVGIASGVGLTIADDWMRTRRSQRLMRGLTAATLVCLLITQASHTRRAMASAAEALLREDPCHAAAAFQIDPAFVRRVKSQYGMNNPECDFVR
jgi:hypothetical protein